MPLGVGRDMTDAEDLLSQMREAREYQGLYHTKVKGQL